MTFARTASPTASIDIPSTDTPQITFVYVTFGTDPTMIDASLRRLVSSCRADGINAEVVVVDNLHPVSGHATAHHLALTTSGVRLATPTDNLGFGGGNELGIAAARSTTIGLLNPDLMVHDGWLAPLLNELDSAPTDVIAPRLLDARGDLDEAGQLVGPDGMTAPAPDGAKHVDYASAACWLMHTSTHERVGGFDPRFHPAYFEDVDFALRLRQLGGRIRVHPTVAVTHLRGGSVAPTDTDTDISAQLATFKELWKTELWRQRPFASS